jgi:LysR family glycine cleavage system transcriptional activator
MPNLRKKLPSANALFVFEAAARCENFTKAAAELYVTQPAVSRMLARMEDHLGVQLFDRAQGKTTLTENGRILYRRISEGFRNIEAALQEIEARNTGKETVTLSVSTAFTTHWLMPRMNKLHKLFPQIDLRFQLIPGPISGPVDDVDIAMRFMDGDDAQHRTVLIMPEILLPVCSPGYEEQTRRTNIQSARAGDTLIKLSEGQIDWFEHFPSFHDETANNTANLLTVPDYAVVLQAALLGQGVAVGWVNVACHWLQTGTLEPAELEALKTGRLCPMVHSRDKPVRPAAAAICDWIIEETRSDIAAVDRMYPALGLPALIQRNAG